MMERAEDHPQASARLFGQRLRRDRHASGLSRAELVQQTGVTAADISLIERGRANPTLATMVKLAEAVGAEVWDMIGSPL